MRRLTARERTLAAKAAALQAVVVPALRLVSLKKVQSLVGALAPLKRSGPRGDEALARAHEAARVVHGVARRSIPRASCLPRSIVLWALLRRMGIEGRLRFGVKRQGSGVDAHAWVEVNGEPVGERPDAYGALE